MLDRRKAPCVQFRLSRRSESVEELAEEGNAFEANAIYGVENARNPRVSEVITHEVPEDDVPAEYLDNDEHLA